MLSRLRGRLSLVDWRMQLIKAALVLVIVGGLAYVVWDAGVDRGYSKCSAETVDAIVEKVNERLPVIQQAERGAAQMEQDMTRIKGELDAEVNRDVPADCSISDQQWMLYNEAAAATRR